MDHTKTENRSGNPKRCDHSLGLIEFREYAVLTNNNSELLDTEIRHYRRNTLIRHEAFEISVSSSTQIRNPKIQGSWDPSQRLKTLNRQPAPTLHFLSKLS